MKFGIRKPSLKKRISARTSWKRIVRHNLGVKAPKGYGWITNPKKATYNLVYTRTTIPAEKGIGIIFLLLGAVIMGIFNFFKTQEKSKPIDQDHDIN